MSLETIEKLFRDPFTRVVIRSSSSSHMANSDVAM